MTSRGKVRVWHAEEGWGVLDSAATPGGCWTHFSAVLVAGYRVLDTGGAVDFTFEAAEQDGYAFRAVEVWPADQAPVRSGNQEPGASSAYRSTLTLTFDRENGTGDS
jgi:CspA family cold shock protein